MAAPSIHRGTGTELELEALRLRILRGLEPVLHAVGVDAHEVHCDVVGSVADLHVVLHGPSAVEPVRQTIGVRVIDAVRGAGRTLGTVTVDYRFGDAA